MAANVQTTTALPGYAPRSLGQYLPVLRAAIIGATLFGLGFFTGSVVTAFEVVSTGL